MGCSSLRSGAESGLAKPTLVGAELSSVQGTMLECLTNIHDANGHN